MSNIILGELKGSSYDWTIEQLNTYDGIITVDREMCDTGCAFVERLRLYTEEDSLFPVYTQDFYHAKSCDEFLDGIGF